MPKGITITPSLREQVISLYKSGLTYEEVADKVSLHKNTVGKIIRSIGYDRCHVGSKIAKSIPTPEDLPASSKAPTFQVTSRTLKLRSRITGHSYTISTESDTIEVESDNALMQLPIASIDAFIDELQNIKTMLGNPS